jgi:light-regulated signal transduction histidine kinase (bacteriophytochrome)
MGRGQLSRRNVSMAAIVEEARQEVMSAAEVADRSIEWQIGELPEVEGDPAMLRLVLINLLSNAVKYTAPRSPARIEVGSTLDASGDRVFFVKDNGVGFDMQYVHKLFGVFQRLHTSEEFEGTGIGLANVRRILHRHGGSVWAESAVDQGATFRFSLRIANPSV